MPFSDIHYTSSGTPIIFTIMPIVMGIIIFGIFIAVFIGIAYQIKNRIRRNKHDSMYRELLLQKMSEKNPDGTAIYPDQNNPMNAGQNPIYQDKQAEYFNRYEANKKREDNRDFKEAALAGITGLGAALINTLGHRNTPPAYQPPAYQPPTYQQSYLPPPPPYQQSYQPPHELPPPYDPFWKSPF
ncbi:hypothetical protein NEOKW01_0922 [Nematocida sp. AWRm80]|nr:hypothetical protein NEOKW01_0922 [Nematocida sp. AWRm80]